jgi:cephalosporin hydroxylase
MTTDAQLEYKNPMLTAEEQAVVDAFHKLYHGKRLWSTTTWMGSPCLKLPHDTWIYQEIIFETRPTLIIETGTAWAGSAHYLGTLFDALHAADPGHQGRVVTIDTESREGELEHPRVIKVKASSIAPATVEQVCSMVDPSDRVMLILDSLHSRDHVLAELKAYAPLVTRGCYAVVEDSNTDYPPDQGPGPLEAIDEYLRSTDRFEIDRSREKLLLTLNPCGYLHCIK